MSGGWRTVAGGLGGIASKFGGEYSVSRLQEEEEPKLASPDMDFTLPINGNLASFDSYGTEMASMDKPIPSENRGYALLKKMGWSGYSGLGKTGQGIVDPIRINTEQDHLGLGKQSEFDETADAATEERRKLESELQAKEDAQSKQLRMDKVEKEERIAEEIAVVTKAFFCEVCNKQYHKVAEFESHLSSYDHHHRKRFKEMQASEKARRGGNEVEKARKKEERQQAKLIAAANKTIAAANASNLAVQSSQCKANQDKCATVIEDTFMSSQLATKPVAFSMGYKPTNKPFSMGFSSAKKAKR